MAFFGDQNGGTSEDRQASRRALTKMGLSQTLAFFSQNNRLIQLSLDKLLRLSNHKPTALQPKGAISAHRASFPHHDYARGSLVISG